MSTETTEPLAERLAAAKEAYERALYVMLRQNAKRQPIGHDAIMGARRALRQFDKEAYAKIIQIEQKHK